MTAEQLEELRRLKERLGNDVFYGEERLNKLKRHNPLHLEAITMLDTLARRVLAAEKLLEANSDMEEAIRSFLAEFRPNCPLVPTEIHEAIQASRAALTAYREASK